jgi:hypothetical protein
MAGNALGSGLNPTGKESSEPVRGKLWLDLDRAFDRVGDKAVFFGFFENARPADNVGERKHNSKLLGCKATQESQPSCRRVR